MKGLLHKAHPVVTLNSHSVAKQHREPRRHKLQQHHQTFQAQALPAAQICNRCQFGSCLRSIVILEFYQILPKMLPSWWSCWIGLASRRTAWHKGFLHATNWLTLSSALTFMWCLKYALRTISGRAYYVRVLVLESLQKTLNLHIHQSCCTKFHKLLHFGARSGLCQVPFPACDLSVSISDKRSWQQGLNTTALVVGGKLFQDLWLQSCSLGSERSANRC